MNPNYICAHCGKVVSGYPDINPCECHKNWLGQTSDAFDVLIEEAYYLHKESTGFAGILYTVLSSVGFQKIDNIGEFIEKFKPDMLFIKSKEDNVEVDVYRSNLENYHIDKAKKKLCVKLKDRVEIKIKY